MVMYKIDRREGGGVAQKSFTRTDPIAICTKLIGEGGVVLKAFSMK